MIKTLLLITLLTIASPLGATSNEPYDDLTDAQLCELVQLELEVAEELGFINKHESEQILRNCLRNI